MENGRSFPSKTPSENKDARKLEAGPVEAFSLENRLPKIAGESKLSGSEAGVTHSPENVGSPCGQCLESLGVREMSLSWTQQMSCL